MHIIEAKELLSAQNGMNLYRGCTHGCIYCDARSRCYHIDHAFEDVAVKGNAPALLEAALRKKRKKCMIGTGAMSDPYIPLERELRLTRRCLELIERYGFGLAIQTKSDHILDDLDLLVSINERARCVVQMTITTFDDALCKLVEPNVCPTSARLAALSALHARGIPTVVWLSPLLPFLNDTEQNVRSILSACAQAGVGGVLCFGMGVTMREGNREYFYRQLDRRFPGLREMYEQTFGYAYECTSPQNDALMRVFYAEIQRYGMFCGVERVFSYLAQPPEDKGPKLF